jgi:AcrR family transcriptional regulator
MRVGILDCAEKLFAEHGFHGTSIRDIASAADVQLALVGYHFGSKEDLLDSVLGRRATVLHAERMQALEAARLRHRGGLVPVAELFDGYASCFLARASRRDSGWRNYSTLVASLANTGQWGALVSKHYDNAARAYLAELERSCPDVNPELIHQSFFFMIAIMVAVCSRPGRIERLSMMRFRSSEIGSLSASISLFVEGGFRNLVGSGDRGEASPEGHLPSRRVKRE